MVADLTSAEQTALQSKFKPIAITMSADEIAQLYMSSVNPDKYNQLLLAKLKDAGGPVEGVIRLKLAHGELYKMKDKITEPSDKFTYMWLPDEYVAAVGVGRA